MSRHRKVNPFPWTGEKAGDFDADNRCNILGDMKASYVVSFLVYQTMKKLCFLFLVGLAWTALATPPFHMKGGPKYETDRGTAAFLQRYLIAGGDIHYPSDADRRKLQASGFFLMKLRPDGIVESVTIKSSTGYTVLDEEVTRTFKTYHFKPNTKGPLLWLVSFLQPTKVIVKAMGYDEKNPPLLPK